MGKKSGAKGKAVPFGIHQVEELAVQTAAMEESRQLWLDSAHNGLNRRLLRAEHARHQKSRLPVWEYLKGLAGEAKITLDAALASIELTSQPVVSRSTAAEIAEKLKSIGFSSQEAVHSILLSFAEVHGYSIASELPVVLRKGQASDAQRCEDLLRRTEARYPDEMRQESCDIRMAVLQRYSREG